MDTSEERWADAPAILESIWRYRWLVLGATLGLGLAGFVWSSQLPPVYETEAQIFLTDPATANVFGQSRGMDLERYVPQQAERLTSTDILATTVDDLADGTSLDELRAQIEVVGDLALGSLTVRVQDGDPDRAATIANTLVEAYEDDTRRFQLSRAERAAAELLSTMDAIEEQIDTLAEAEPTDDGDTTGQAQRDVLVRRLLELDSLSQQLRVDARLFGSGVEFVEAATPPEAPIAPTPRRTTAISAFLGALLAAALAYLLAGRGGKILGQDEPSEILGVPLLGVLPTYKVGEFSSLRERARLDPRTAEAYRFVHSSLARVLHETGARSVLVTSASPGAGKTETALQLAITSADRGFSVLLVDADVRIRGLSEFLRADRTEGLINLGDPGGPAPAELITSYPLNRKRDLSVLTAGSVTNDGPAQIQESWFSQAFPGIIEDFDLVVLDSSPLLAVADTAMVAAYCDAVVLVVREGSQVEDLVRVRQRMRFVGDRLVGYVYLSPRALAGSAFNYGLVRAQSRGLGEREEAPTDPDGPSVRAKPAGSSLRWPPSPTRRPLQQDRPPEPMRPTLISSSRRPDQRQANATGEDHPYAAPRGDSSAEESERPSGSRPDRGEDEHREQRP
jgi:Mrp family chromosome partitioning ATPase/capsular polysaccharide biosynthesis protein